MGELFKDAVIFTGGLVYGLLSAFWPWTLLIAAAAGGLIGEWQSTTGRRVIRVVEWQWGTILGLILYSALGAV